MGQRRERNIDLDIAFPYFATSAALDMKFRQYQDIEEELEEIEDFDDDYSGKYLELMNEYHNKRNEPPRDEAIREMVERHMSDIS